MRIAIVEDEHAVAEQLQEYVKRCCQENGQDVSVTIFPDGAAIANNYYPVWDMILLDIEMPHMDGMTTAEHIRR